MHPVLVILLNIIPCIEIIHSLVITRYGNNGKESEDRPRCDDDCSFCPACIPWRDWYQFHCTRSKLSIGYCMTLD